MNNLNSKYINADALRDMVDKGNTICIHQLAFFRNFHTGTLSTKMIEKKIRFTSDKRLILNDLTTLPYGYVCSNNSMLKYANVCYSK